MELAAFVTLRPTLRVFAFSGTELAKVLGGPGDGICKKLHLDTTKRFSAESDVEEDDWICRHRDLYRAIV